MVNDIQERIDAQIKLPEGYHVEYGGQFESEQAASRTLISEMGSPSEQRKLSTKLLEKPHPASRPAAAMLCSRMFVL